MTTRGLILAGLLVFSSTTVLADPPPQIKLCEEEYPPGCVVPARWRERWGGLAPRTRPKLRWVREFHRDARAAHSRALGFRSGRKGNPQIPPQLRRPPSILPSPRFASRRGPRRSRGGHQPLLIDALSRPADGHHHEWRVGSGPVQSSERRLRGDVRRDHRAGTRDRRLGLLSLAVRVRRRLHRSAVRRLHVRRPMSVQFQDRHLSTSGVLLRVDLR